MSSELSTDLGSKGITIMKQHFESIKYQYIANYDLFIKSLPTSILLIPLIIFLLSPSISRGVYLFGAIFISVISLTFTPISDPNNFITNYPSFHGLVLGYVVGYLLVENILLSKLGSMLSTGVMGLIMCSVLVLSLYNDSEVSKQILNVGLGWILGILVGGFFSYAEHKALEKEKNYSHEHHIDHIHKLGEKI